MDTQNWPKNEWEDIYYGLQEISRKMENIMFNCVDDIDAKRFAQDCYDDIETWMDNCKQKGNFTVETLDLTSSKKPIKSADRHYKYDEYLGNIYDSDPNNADYWTREEYGEMVEKARDIFYPAVQKAANACRFTVSDNEAEYVAEKCVRQFFDNTSWDEAVNRPEEYYVNSSKKPIESAMPGREKGIRAIMDEYGCSWEEAEEIMNEGIESACHGKSKKKSKKSIKSNWGMSDSEVSNIINSPEVQSILPKLKQEAEGDIPGASARREVPSAHEYININGKEYDIIYELEYGTTPLICVHDLDTGWVSNPVEITSSKKIEQTRRARNTASLNNLYGKMFS